MKDERVTRQRWGRAWAEGAAHTGHPGMKARGVLSRHCSVPKARGAGGEGVERNPESGGLTVKGPTTGRLGCT